MIEVVFRHASHPTVSSVRFENVTAKVCLETGEVISPVTITEEQRSFLLKKARALQESVGVEDTKINLVDIPRSSWESMMNDALTIGKRADYYDGAREDLEIWEALEIARLDPSLIWLSVSVIRIEDLAEILDASPASVLDVLDKHGQVVLQDTKGTRLLLPYMWALHTVADLLSVSRRPWAEEGINDYKMGDIPCLAETAINDWQKANRGILWFD